MDDESARERRRLRRSGPTAGLQAAQDLAAASAFGSRSARRRARVLAWAVIALVFLVVAVAVIT